MSFDYQRSGKHNSGESFWTSNSDLFLGLSSIFLILYVVASLRSGADGVNSATENKKLKVQIQDLETQLKTYESVKEQYMQKQASKDEKDEYDELMDKLTLLKEEAKNEKENLTKQASENAQKEKALNKYQQMVRNMINSSNFAKTKVVNRNEVINEKEQVIDEKNVEITVQNKKIVNLNQDIVTKQNQIKGKEAQIDQINYQLNNKVSELKRSYKSAKVTQKVYQTRLKKLKTEAEQKVAYIEEQKQNTIGELKNAKLTLRQTESQLNNTKGALAQSQVEVEQRGQQISSLSTKLGAAQADTKAKMDALNAKFQGDKASERTAFENALKNQKNLSNAEIAKREAAFKADADAKTRQLANQMAGLAGQLKNTEAELEQKGQEIAGLNDKLGSAAEETKARMDALSAKYAAERAGERAAFDGALKNQKNLGEAEIARREAAFKAEGDAKNRKLQGELAGLAGQLKNTEGQLAVVKSELQARKNIAQEIKRGFDKIGVKADIDLESGDVLLDFGQSYFESNSANLTTDMRAILQKAMPVYSKSLFGNQTVSSKISAVEVIGFASPTYKGRVIDPNSNKPDDREGLKYNMDLSYKRAKSIFNYILDNKEMSFEHRDALVPNLKVSGRSFLDLMKTDNRNIASIEAYCKKNDCKKSQRVIIRFSMDKKK